MQVNSIGTRLVDGCVDESSRSEPGAPDTHRTRTLSPAGLVIKLATAVRSSS